MEREPGTATSLRPTPPARAVAAGPQRPDNDVTPKLIATRGRAARGEAADCPRIKARPRRVTFCRAQLLEADSVPTCILEGLFVCSVCTCMPACVCVRDKGRARSCFHLGGLCAIYLQLSDKSTQANASVNGNCGILKSQLSSIVTSLFILVVYFILENEACKVAALIKAYSARYKSRSKVSVLIHGLTRAPSQ